METILVADDGNVTAGADSAHDVPEGGGTYVEKSYSCGVARKPAVGFGFAVRLAAH
jgi:hypothetical protein